MQQISKVFIDVNMGMGIPGLLLYLLESGVSQAAIDRGNIWMFMNRKKTQAKILINQDLLLLYRPQDGEITIDRLKKLNQRLRHQLLGGKVEQVLSKHIDRHLAIVVDEEGIRVS